MSTPPQGSAPPERNLKILPTLNRRGAELAAPAAQRAVLARLALEGELAGSFARHVAAAGHEPYRSTGIDVLQLNLGRICNQTCRHCHVDAGPDRTEDMSREVAEACLSALERSDIPTVDITGGAPEMAAEFRFLVEGARKLGRHVMDRCNLTILLAPRYADLPEFLAEHQVEVVCSLPHYRELNTDRQRGTGVYRDSIEALRRLNALGYGREGTGLRLVLVTNPVGAFLPAGQASLEAEWKRALERDHGVVFNQLYALANMPIARFLEDLEERGNTQAYLQRLVDAFNPAAAANAMCRNTLSVGYDGRLFDCDFNQMLDLELHDDAPRTIFEFDAALLDRREIVTGRHCFGCTAGAGSSCGGATA